MNVIRELHQYRELLWIWSLRDIKARYKQSLFGFAWAVFQPIALTAVFVIAFSFFIQLPSDGIPYPVFVYTAMLPWTFFTRALAMGIGSLVYNMNLITKIYMPRVTFPLAAIATGFVDLLFGTLVLAVLIALYQLPIYPTIAFVPVLFLVQLALMIGLTLAGSALNVYYRDVGQMVPVLLQVWMYACPIVYPLSVVPEWLRPLYMLNPMAVIIHGYRQVILMGELPNAYELGLAAVISFVILVGGYRIFKRLEGRFADII